MTINFLGDSITAGAGASRPSKRYTTLLCEDLGAKENNLGIGGTRMAKQIPCDYLPESGEDFCARISGIDANADFTFVFGGTNDYGHGNAPFGVVGDKTSDTFCGAVWFLGKSLIDLCGKDKVCFILPMPRLNEDNPFGEGDKREPGKTLEEYRKAIKEVIGGLSIDVLDLSDSFPLPKTSPSELTVDGLHPNDEGHALLAKRLEEYLNKKGLIG